MSRIRRQLVLWQLGRLNGRISVLRYQQRQYKPCGLPSGNSEDAVEWSMLNMKLLPIERRRDSLRERLS